MQDLAPADGSMPRSRHSDTQASTCILHYIPLLARPGGHCSPEGCPGRPLCVRVLCACGLTARILAVSAKAKRAYLRYSLPPLVPAPAVQGPEDPYDVLLGRYTGMGYSRDEVAMALTIAGPDHSNDADKIGARCGAGALA